MLLFVSEIVEKLPTMVFAILVLFITGDFLLIDSMLDDPPFGVDKNAAAITIEAVYGLVISTLLSSTILFTVAEYLPK